MIASPTKFIVHMLSDTRLRIDRHTLECTTTYTHIAHISLGATEM